MPEAGMKRKSVIILVLIVAVIAAVAIAVPLLINAERFRPTIEARLSAALARPVLIEKLSFSWLAGGISAQNVSIAEDPAFATKPFLTARALDVNVEVWPLLLHQQVLINSLALREPQVTLIQERGRWNVASLGKSPAPPAKAPAAPAPVAAESTLLLKKLVVSDGRVLVRQPGVSQTYTQVNLQATNVNSEAQVPFTLTALMPGNGKLKLDGAAGPLPRADATLTPVQANVSIERLDLGNFLGKQAGVDGTLGLQAKLRMQRGTAHVEGTATVDNAVLAKGGSPLRRPLALDLIADYDLPGQKGRVTRGDLRLGKTTAKVTGDFTTRGAATVLDMGVAAPAVLSGDLQELLPALAVAMPGGVSLQGGTTALALNMEGPTDRLVTSGTVHMSDITLTGFNLGAKIKTVATLAGIETGSNTTVQSLDARLQVAPGGVRIDDLKTNVAGLGLITGAGTLSANKALNFNMVAHLSGKGGLLGGLVQAAGVGQLSTLPFRIAGTTANPQFVPDVGAIIQARPNQVNQQQAPQQNPLGDVLNQIFRKKK